MTRTGIAKTAVIIRNGTTQTFVTMNEKLSETPSVAHEPQTSQAVSNYIRPQARKLHDPDVNFEEYHYYAKKTREEQDALPSPKSQWTKLIKGKKEGPDDGSDLHQPDVNLGDPQMRLTITDEEWTNASRAFRTASWGAGFYLVFEIRQMHFSSTLLIPGVIDHH